MERIFFNFMNGEDNPHQPPPLLWLFGLYPYQLTAANFNEPHRERHTGIYIMEKIFSEVLSLAEFKAAQNIDKLEFEISKSKKHQSGKPVVFFLNGEGGFLAESSTDDNGHFKTPEEGSEIVVGKSGAGWTVYTRQKREIVFTL